MRCDPGRDVEGDRLSYKPRGGVAARILLTLRTVRHLRPVQIRSLATHAVRRPSLAARSITEAVWDEARAGCVLEALSSLGPVNGRTAAEAGAVDWLKGELRMLGRTEAWNGRWRTPDKSQLWSLHLQYHDILADLAWYYSRTASPEALEALGTAIDGWLDEWEAGGAPAWDSYPLAVRCVNWLRILTWAGSALGSRRERMIQSLAAQLDVLSHNLENHLLGNHLLREAWALAVAGAPFAGPWGAALFDRGIAIFCEQLIDQVGPDGIHEERTPMYQARIVRDALEVVAVSRAVGAPLAKIPEDRVCSAAEALAWLRRPDGSLFLLNDSANDHGVDLDQLSLSAERLCGARMGRPDGVKLFKEGKIAIVRDATASDGLIVDLGAPGPSHQPGHAHAGALGFELDLSGHPVLVDAGCSGYKGELLRPYQRSTRAHNTVAIDGRDQSEMWATFRVARRARVQGEGVSGTPSEAVISGTCSPYFDSVASHERTIRRAGRTVEVTDRVVGARGSRLESHLHFHPDWTPTIEGAVINATGNAGNRVRILTKGADRLTLHRGEMNPPMGWYAPKFGEAVKCWVVRLVVEENREEVLSYTVSPL